MVTQLQHLSEQEIDLVYRAPILTSILISGAEGPINDRKINAAIEFAKKEVKEARALMYDLYLEISEDMEQKIQETIRLYPEDPPQRSQQILHELEKLNEILPKLDKSFAVVYYLSLKNIARKIARSTGGFLGIFGKISKAERKYLGLDMIQDPLKIFR
jgi:vacuolar-type H+-ATPase subunit H